MKRFGKLFNAAVKASAFMVAAMVSFACVEPKEDPSVEVNPTEVSSDAAGTTVDVTVNSNVAWTAEAQDKWVTVSPAEGVAGETKVTVTVKKNNSEDARETSVTFTGETAVATVAVSQFGKDVVTIDKNAYAATPAGGSDAVKVTSNTNWTAASSVDWVTVTPAEGAAGEANVTVTVAPNAAAEAREGKVTFTAGEAKAEYTVSQEAVSIAVSQNTVNVAGEGETKTVTVTANAAWKAAASAEWVVVDPIEGEAGAVEVTIVADANETETDRTATVTFAVNENVTAVVTVSQAFVKPTGKVTITVPSVTSSTATVVCTPDPVEGFTYYWDILPKETADMLLPTDEEVIAYWVNYINELLAQYEGATWADVLSEGVEEYVCTGLAPNTDYYVVAFGVDESGNVTSGLYRKEFKTADVNPAIKEWIGTWTVTSSDSYHSPKGGTAGLTGKPATRTITIGTESVFKLKIGESDLIVAGLSYTDDLPLYSYTSSGEPIPMETVGTIDENGNLKLINGQEVQEYGDYGMITWIGSSYVMEDWYMINGSYAPYTLKLNADKTTATGTPYSGKLSSGQAFTTAYYDIKLVAENGGASSFYTDNTTGALSGTWTLTKVVEEPAAASKMLVKKSKAEKAIIANEKKANFMKTFNSKALFAL